jgi:acyl-CoA synthetase (AMP-forming)/AMP-acid ligase II
MNTADYLLEHACDDTVALITEQETFSYKELRQASERIVGELLSLGVKPLDRVGILGNNTLFWVASYLAVLKLDAVAVPFAVTLKPEDIQRNERFAQCKIVCAEEHFYRKFAVAFAHDIIILLDSVLKSSGPSDWPTTDASHDIHQDAALMLTSGTTALPRAVRITHRNIQANTDSIIEYLSLDQNERIMVILPFYYCFGTSLLHTHLRVGASLVFNNSFVYPELVLDQMQTYDCTGFAGVPSSYQMLLRNSTFPRRAKKPLRKIQQAGGKLQNVLINELVACQPQAQVFVMYGQTEATARLSYLPPALLPTKLGSMGKGIPGVELRVLGENGEKVKPGEVGEIIAIGDNISPGYWNDPAASAEKFVNGTLRTGDLATVDEDGFIYVVDRKADFIKSYGYRVSSQEVESSVLEMPEVVAAAAIGEPDLVRGEAIKVFVTLRSDASVGPQDILAFCKKRMARHLMPRDIVIVKSLPMNAHGKVIKSELKKLDINSQQAAAATV